MFYRIILFKKKMFCCAMEDKLWCLTPISTIYRSVLLVGKTGVLGENH